MEKLAAFQKKLGYQFNDEQHLHRALRHASLNVDTDNEALEFLGDRVLGLAISDILVSRYPHEKEGLLARRLNQLVSGQTCAKIARHWQLQEIIKTDSGIQKREEIPEAILADACEAVLGAVFLDGGLQPAADLVATHWKDLLDAQAEAPKDSKSALQEYLAKRGHDLPSYKIVESTGPAHAPHFIVEVSSILGAARGGGGSRKQADQEAAAALLALLKGGSA